MLFACLQRHAQRALAAGIDGDANDAAGDRALVLVSRSEEGGVRSAESHRDAEALGRAECDVGAHLARRLKQHQRHQVCGDGGDAALGLDRGDRVGEVNDFTGVVRILEEGAEDIFIGGFLGRAEDEFETEIAGARLEHVDRLREAAGVDEEAVRRRFAHAPCHRHRLGSSGGFIEQRGVGEFEAGQVDDHLLVVEQRLQTPLGDFGLIGRVGRVPARILEHVAQDDRRRPRVGIAHADQRFVGLVLARDRLQRRQRLGFGPRFREWQRRRQADGGRNGFVDQRLQVGCADGRQHGRDVVG